MHSDENEMGTCSFGNVNKNVPLLINKNLILIEAILNILRVLVFSRSSYYSLIYA